MGPIQGSFIQDPVKFNRPIGLHGMTVIITGANGGLKYGCARRLLTAEASKVFLACRTLSKGEAARQRLLEDPLADGGNLEA